VPSCVDGSDVRYIKKYQLTSEFLSEETSEGGQFGSKCRDLIG
jgi:hypothetical protein